MTELDFSFIRPICQRLTAIGGWVYTAYCTRSGDILLVLRYVTVCYVKLAL